MGVSGNALQIAVSYSFIIFAGAALWSAARSAAGRSAAFRRFRFGSPSDNPTYLAGRARIYDGLRLAAVPEG
jgi:hypothetical protein